MFRLKDPDGLLLAYDPIAGVPQTPVKAGTLGSMADIVQVNTECTLLRLGFFWNAHY